jgi:DNA-binding NarL/FixJ family response regulator
MRILLVDDHSLFRDGLKFLLTDLDQRIEFVESDTCLGVPAVLADQDIDVVLLDLHLPDTDGLDGLQRVREWVPGARIVMLSSEDDPQIIRAVIDEGAAGFIPKSSTQTVLIAALRLIVAGGIYLPPHALQNLREQHAIAPQPPGNSGPLALLTPRQRSVLQLAIQGKVNKIIAREMDISEATVKAHLSACFRALGVKNRTEAVFAAANAGLTAQ